MKIDFETLYKQLNPRQKEAVDAIDGPVMVIAGPGTGKTQILSLRIANILKKTDAKAGDILAITYTESGVTSMRARLVSIIGPDAYKVHIYTFHGLAKRIIDDNPDYFPRIVGAKVATDADRMRILSKIINENEFEIIKPVGEPLHNVYEMNRAISHLKREAVMPATFAEIIEKQIDGFKNISDLYHEKGAHKGKMKSGYVTLEKEIKKNAELVRVYAEYEEALKKEKLYDFEDMILETLKALKNREDLLRIYQEQFQYILADEHQDANASQNELLLLLCGFHDSPNLFVVGDDKQAIFRFQGASLSNFLSFKKHYKEAKLISLDTNYRSTQTILSHAHLIASPMPKGEGIERAELKAGRSADEKEIIIHPTPSFDAEASEIALRVKGLLSEGAEAGEIAVLYRNNNDAERIEDALGVMNIPFVTLSQTDALKHPAVRRLIDIVIALTNPSESDTFARMLFVPFFDIPLITIEKIIRHSKKEGVTMLEALNLFVSNAEENDPIKLVSRKIESWGKMMRDYPAKQAILEVLNDEAVLPFIMKEGNADESISAIKAFISWVEKNDNGEAGSAARIQSILDVHKAFNITIPLGRRETNGKVKLMTMHTAKGREYNHVLLSGAYEGHMSGKRGKNYFKIGFDDFDISQYQNDDDDERRLFYVALTRAKETFDVFYPTANEDGKELLPSSFLGELDSKKLVTITSDDNIVFPKNRAHNFKIDKEYIKSLFMSHSMSATALNHYLECPWKYYFLSLMQLPKKYDPNQAFGVAMHKGMEKLYQGLRDGVWDESSAIVAFEEKLSTMFLDKAMRNTLLKKGRNAISAYVKQNAGLRYSNIETEKKIRSHVSITDLGDIRIKGTFDLLHIEGDNLFVHDFKTGKYKSKNALMGGTKSGDGAYWRQIIFYKLLAEQEMKNVNYKEGIIEFVIPDEKGQIRAVEFEVSPEDVSILKESIQKMAHEMTNGSFVDKGCNEKDCEYCSLAKSAYIIE